MRTGTRTLVLGPASRQAPRPTIMHRIDIGYAEARLTLPSIFGV